MPRQLDDWLERYLQFTQNSEPPTQYHLWSAITAIASVLRRKCYTDWGLRGIVYPNLYVSLVGPPGGRKGTAMKMIKPMLQQLDIPMGSDALGSTQRLYHEIIKSSDVYIQADGVPMEHKSLSVWSEEFQVFLSDKDPMLIASLTDLFDAPDIWKYSTVAREEESLGNCWLTIIGAITPSLLQTKLSQDAVGGGLLSRIIFVVGYGPIKKIALPFMSKEEKLLQKQLANDLAQIALLAGPFILKPCFLKTYSNWYENNVGAEGVNNEKFLGYNSRRALHLNKLCMIISASESDDMYIYEHHFRKALAILEETESHMPQAFQGLGLGHHANVYAKILSFIKKKDDFSFNEILDSFILDAKPRDMEEYLSMAERTGKIVKEKSATKTRYVVVDEMYELRDTDYLNKTLYKRIV